MNLEQFPTSETARKMLGYITGNGFYDNSYVGKWIFQVMGQELDDARRIILELPEQAFVETATWGLRYHEEKYGLPIRENLPAEERRKLILEKRDLRAPMTPWRMESIIGGILGCGVEIEDINEEGSTIQHPNMFIVYLEGEGEFSIGEAFRKLNAIKQSHTFYELHIRIAKFIIEERFLIKATIRTGFNWWGAALDGKYLLDGSILMGARMPPYFIPRFNTSSLIEERFTFLPETHRIIGIGEYGKISADMKYRMAVSVWEYCLDGKYLLDGNSNMDAIRAPYFKTLFRNAVKHDGTVLFSKAINRVFRVVNENPAHFREIVKVIFPWNQDSITLDGEHRLDGVLSLSNGSPPYAKKLHNRVKMKHKEDFKVTMYTPSDNIAFDGSVVLDGVKKLNSGREEL